MPEDEETSDAPPAAPAAASVAGSLSAVPKWVWLAGGAAALYFFVLRKKG
jgi:hypothetical protein